MREGLSFHDNLHPASSIVGESMARAEVFANLLLEGSRETDVPTSLHERPWSWGCQAIFLQLLTYVCCFCDELDSYAMLGEMDSRQIIEGVRLDPRIGWHYNSRSFGYGRCCIPKNTKQLLANYSQEIQNLTQAILKSNSTRQDFLADKILIKSPKTVGIFDLW